MNRKRNAIISITSICITVILFLIFLIHGINIALTNFLESTNTVCRNQKFATTEEAVQTTENEKREIHDSSLDYCPPYTIKYTFEQDNNIIVFYSCCYSFDGEERNEYAVRILSYNNDGTLSFDSGFADFKRSEAKEDEDYYYFTNIDTSKGTKSISFLYLPKDSNKEIYVDGVKTQKQLVNIDGEEFYICYAISNKDTFLSNLTTPIEKRHKIKINSSKGGIPTHLYNTRCTHILKSRANKFPF